MEDNGRITFNRYVDEFERIFNYTDRRRLTSKNWLDLYNLLGKMRSFVEILSISNPDKPLFQSKLDELTSLYNEYTDYIPGRLPEEVALVEDFINLMNLALAYPEESKYRDAMTETYNSLIPTIDITTASGKKLLADLTNAINYVNSL